jgi:hypothetical protein
MSYDNTPNESGKYFRGVHVPGIGQISLEAMAFHALAQRLMQLGRGQVTPLEI